jgi:hypothetical protein
VTPGFWHAPAVRLPLPLRDPPGLADPLVFGTFGATPGYGWPFAYCPVHAVRWRGEWDECWICGTGGVR